jgi:hypothetical protein
MINMAMNCVRCNRSTARLAVSVEQQKLREFERNELERIAEDRQQMNMALPARISSELEEIDAECHCTPGRENGQRESCKTLYLNTLS